MHATRELITYLTKIQNKIDKGEPISRRAFEMIEDSADERAIAYLVDMQGLNYCEECDMEIDWMTQDGHIIFKNGESIIVAVCCEGYFQLDIEYK